MRIVITKCSGMFYTANQASNQCKILRHLRLLLVYICLIVVMRTRAAKVYVFRPNATYVYRPPEAGRLSYQLVNATFPTAYHSSNVSRKRHSYWSKRRVWSLESYGWQNIHWPTTLMYPRIHIYYKLLMSRWNLLTFLPSVLSTDPLSMQVN